MMAYHKEMKLNEKKTYTPAQINQMAAPFLPGYLGVEFTRIEGTELVAQLPVKPELLAPNGFLHAGSVISLADTVAGVSCMINLPEGANSFTTIELKSNHFGTAREGMIEAIGKPVHMGRTTQVWDVVVTDQASAKTIALFRCTQMILYPKST
jgi:1,4-dihydroxy-2-naphthoyl-CoA hydrolase